MKKNKLFLLLCGLSMLSAKAQTTLPATWSFSSTTLPAFWTEINANSGTSPVPYYTASGNTPPAYKFDGTGDMLTIFFNGNPGALTYFIAGNSFSGSTFLVEESANGSSWTTLHTHTGPTSTYTQITDLPNAASRYIRFNYSNKVTGNVGIDDVNIATGAATPSQEINVKQGSSTIVTGGSYMFSSPVGTTTPVSFSIENLGTVNALTITSATITGAMASEFVLTTVPSTIAAASASNLVINFTPTSAGTRTVTLSIANNDSDENPYIINLTGLGGTYFTEPANQPTSLTISNIKSYRAGASFVASTSTPTGYLILKKQGSSPITEIPADGTSYMIGDAIGSTKVISTSSLTSVGLSNIYAGLTYQIAIFAYNGSGNFVNYNQTAPLLGNFTTPSAIPLNEYSSLNVNNSNFLTALSAQIYPHQSTFYGNYDETMIRLFTARDTTGGQKVVTCVYSSENYVYTEPFVWGYFSREHSYCHNWMPTNPADGSGTAPNNVERKEYNDQHHLFPTNQNGANAPRSNYPQGEIVGTPATTYLACKTGNDVFGNHVFEPRAQHKGDFARAVMYMATAYNMQTDAYGVAQNWKFRNPISGTINYGQDQNILKKWHFQDPPDAWEISRNDFLDSLQGNRNPFIDSMRYACYIDFSNMTYIAYTGGSQPCYTAVGIKENVATHFEYVLAPNPTSGEFNLMIDAKVAEKFNLDIMDVTGRNVYKKDVDVVNGFNNVVVNDIKLQSGVYFVNLHYKNEKITRKLVIQ